MSTADPKVLRENIARVRNSLRRGDFVPGLRMLAQALLDYAPMNLFGPQRFGIENAFIEVLKECSRQSDLHPFLTPPGSSEPAQLRYLRGREEALGNLFSTIATRIERTAIEAREEQIRQLALRRADLLDKAKEYLAAGDLPRGRSFAHKLLEEFGAEDPELQLEVAKILNRYNLPLDAATLIESAVDAFPKESALYSLAIEIYTAAREFDKAETMYRRVFRQFGAHPVTMCKLARLFISAGRRQKAEDLMYQLLQNHPGYEEANAILTEVERRPTATL